MTKHSMVCAGIDTGKRKLDVAIDGSADRRQVANEAKGHQQLSAWLRQRRVTRVGIEASGGYEQPIVALLRSEGFVVVVLQPAQVRAYAKFHLQLAKNDRIDAALIATCTTAVKRIHAAPDPRLVPLADHQTLIEQITDQISRIKHYLEACREPRIQTLWREEIKQFQAILRKEQKALEASIRAHRDLAERLDLIASVQGIGLPTAMAILVRLPEIGRLTREQVAALVGLAPYDDDSGDHFGARHIAGGRKRLRGSVYAAAFAAAYHWNPQLQGVYKRLRAAGKSHKQALVACARKLIIFANSVVARGTPWTVASASA